MMYEEFIRIAGYEVSHEDYTEIIEPMYMATSLDKYEFIKTLNKSRFALKTERQLINEIKKEAAHLYDICGKCVDHESLNRIYEILREIDRRFHKSYYIQSGYEYEELRRGCTYPKRLIDYHNPDNDIILVK